MAYSAIDWDVAPEIENASIHVPAVMPLPRARATRRVGIVKTYFPSKTYGMVAPTGCNSDAIFCIDDVAIADRSSLDSGQPVTFEIVAGPDGSTAKRIRRDAITLPPPPGDAMISKGWR